MIRKNTTQAVFNLSIVMILAVVLGACSSDENPTKSNVGTAKSSVNENATNVSLSNANLSSDGANSLVVANVSNAESNQNSALGQISRRMSKKEKNVASVDPSTIDLEKILTESSRPAAEDSVYAVALTDKAIERRIFKSHKQIAKIEKVSSGTAASIKVTLRDGNVVEVDGEKVKSIFGATSADILLAAGLADSKTAAETRRPAKP